ncbi:ACP phosphodiesterase [Marinomonas sp. C2222]|uniref:ACP phosphodiesterase n=1 Tax=Marinomonas sargassi TaxID=2984494 RepID=A0ABT2YQP9_9GAMM|nr:ACP phosphodiesterase [Marinomonas sargassi]MCV2402222.1 ACP phosphodiesterase [Marinomonas sargassi]
MNYLAHLHIAQLTNTSPAGNLLGDFSVDVNSLDSDLYIGWQLHQQVDVMVDKHPASLAFRALPRSGRRRFAGIIQDILMDYWLVQNWQKFGSLSLTDFCEQVVIDLSRDKGRCPVRLANMITSLEHHNWLAGLGTYSGVEKAIFSIMKRWRYGHYLQDFVDELPEVILQAEQPFLSLYPDLLSYVKELQDKKAEANAPRQTGL